MFEKRRIDVNNPLALATAVWLGIVGASVLLVLPVFVGTLMESRGYSSAEVGWIGSADLIGYALASFLAFRTVRRYSWRRLVLAGLGLMLAGNVLSVYAESFSALLLVRIVLAGTGAGLVICVPYTLLGDTARPERNTGIYFGVNVLGGSIGLLVLPFVANRFGASGMFLLLGGTALSAVLPVLFWLPSSGTSQENRTTRMAPNARARIFLIFAGIALFNFGFGGVWAFVARLGVDAGLSTIRVGTVLSATYLFSALGSGISSWQGRRYGYLIPYAGAIVVITGSIAFFLFSSGPVFYIFGLILLNFGWNYAITWQFSAVFTHDDSGRMPVFIILVESAGLMLGPGFAGLLIAYFGMDAALYVALLTGVGSFHLFFLAHRTPDRYHPLVESGRGDTS